MNTKRFWTLDEEDRDVVDRLAVGLGRKPARVLAYLVCRAEQEDAPATMLEIRIGTDLNRKTVADSLSRLRDRELIARTTLSDGSRGRPPKAWAPTMGRERIIGPTYDRHAASLIRRAASVHNGEAKDGGLDVDTAIERDLTLALNWHPNGLHAPFYAARAADEYDDRGVSVAFDHREGSRRALDAVTADEATVCVVGAATVARARTAGEPVIPLAVVYQRAMTVLYTARELFGEELRSVEQLRGRRIGMPECSETGVLGRLFLSQADVEEDVTFVDTEGEEREALLADEADVVTGTFSDPRMLTARGLTADTLHVADHFPIYGPTLVTRADALREHREVLRRFLAGTLDGWSVTRRAPGRAATAVAAVSGDPKGRTRRTVERAVEEFGESEAVRGRGWGWQRPEMWDRLSTALAQGALLRKVA